MSEYQATSAAPADHPGPIKVIRENSPNFFYDGKPPAARTERRLKQGGIFEYLMHPTLRYDLGSGQNICSCLQTDTEDGDT